MTRRQRVKEDAGNCVHVYGVFSLCFDGSGRAFLMICEKSALKKLGISVSQEITGQLFHLSYIPEADRYFYTDGDDGLIQLEAHTIDRPDTYEVLLYSFNRYTQKHLRLMHEERLRADHPLEAIAAFIREQFDDGDAMFTPREVHERRGVFAGRDA